MRFRLIDKTFLAKPKRYILQSLLAVVVVTVLLYFVETITHAAIVAALGASTFIVFAMPKTVAAEPRRLIGGHIIGIISGLICYFALDTGPCHDFFTSIDIINWFPEAMAVGLSIFLMTIMNFEHPPAAGTALGIVTHEWTVSTIGFVVAFAVVLALIGFLLRKYLRNLST
ncbi:MAG: HPP family protein [Dehalococcoidales bacterium]|nr:HPP family protein [Dehalococcoidales bacterium]